MTFTTLWQSSTHENAQRRELMKNTLHSIAYNLWWNLGLMALFLLEHQLCVVSHHFFNQYDLSIEPIELMLCRCALIILLGNACILFARYFSLRHKLTQSSETQSCPSSSSVSCNKDSTSLTGDGALLKTMYFPSMHQSRTSLLSNSALGSPAVAASSTPKVLLDNNNSWLMEAAPRYGSSPYSPSSLSPPLSASITPPSFLTSDNSATSKDFSALSEFSLSGSAFGAFSYSPSQQVLRSSVSEYSPLRQNIYQLATPDPTTSSKSLLALDSSGSGIDLRKNNSLTTGAGGVSGISSHSRVTLQHAELELATERLRRWLHGTVLIRLVKEIDIINAKLGDLGHEEMRIGEARIDALRQLAQRPQAVYFGWSLQLAGVIPFLDCTTHQSYLVQRLRELANGGAMGVYRWNAGSCESDLQPWREHLPPDAALILHLFASYMDARLPAQPRCPEGRSFSSLHMLRMGDKCDWHGQRQLAIRQTAERPPHFNLMLGGSESQELEVAPGNRNAFHVILLFLQELIVSHDGYLHGINLGPSGLNILWVLHGEQH